MPWFSWTKEILDFKKQNPTRNLNLNHILGKKLKEPQFPVHGNSTYCFPASSSDIRMVGFSCSWALSFHVHLAPSIVPSLPVAPSCTDVPRSSSPKKLPGMAPGEGTFSSAVIHFLANTYPCSFSPLLSGRAKEGGVTWSMPRSFGQCPHLYWPPLLSNT